MRKSKSMTFAERELDILTKSSTDPNNRPIIEPFAKEILALVNKFGNSGQSGGSAPYTAGAISSAVKKLLLQKPICPITGMDEEWSDVSSMSSPESEPTFQNSRCPALFKCKDGKAYYLDAIVWKNQHGTTWSGCAKSSDGSIVYARQYVKQFPFDPKTFIIDVIEKEVAPDDWEFTIKDESQLKEVFEYYDLFKPEKKVES